MSTKRNLDSLGKSAKGSCSRLEKAAKESRSLLTMLRQSPCKPSLKRSLFQDEQRGSDILDADETTPIDTTPIYFPTLSKDTIPTTPVDAPEPPKKKHKVGYNPEWTIDRPWVMLHIEVNSEGIQRETLLCKLCRNHFVGLQSRRRCWIDYGFKTVRKDSLLTHERSLQHGISVRNRRLANRGSVKTWMKMKNDNPSTKPALPETQMKSENANVRSTTPETVMVKSEIEALPEARTKNENVCSIPTVKSEIVSNDKSEVTDNLMNLPKVNRGDCVKLEISYKLTDFMVKHKLPSHIFGDLLTLCNEFNETRFPN